MELSYDWKAFQTFFVPKRKNNIALPNKIEPVYLIVDRNIVISVFSDGEDLSEWVGATADEVLAELAHRQILVYEREKVDQWISNSLDGNHYLDQIQHLRKEAKPKVITKTVFHFRNAAQKHFLLQAIEGWWIKVFPANYGVYIRLDGNSTNALLLIVKRGRLNSFHIPDLSSMIPERTKVASDVVRYLSERHLLPIQGLFLSSEEWAEWSEIENPWPAIFKAIRSDKTKLTPFKLSLVSLIAGKTYFGV